MNCPKALERPAYTIGLSLEGLKLHIYIYEQMSHRQKAKPSHSEGSRKCQRAKIA